MATELETSFQERGTYFHNGRRWYNAYVPSVDNPGKKCLKNASPAYVLARDSNIVVDGVNKTVKSFTPFDSLSEMSGFATHNSNDSYYEYLQDTQGERKLYFDIDHKVRSGEEGLWKAYHQRHLGALTDVLAKLFAEYNLPFDTSDARIYHSCGVEGDWYKFSFHYVVTGYRTMSYKHHGHICREVIRRMNTYARNYDLCIDNSHPKLLDTAPYNCNQAFRLYGSCKSGSTRRKTLLNLTGNENGYTMFAPDGSIINCERTGLATFITHELESLILQPPLNNRVQLDGSFCPMPEDKRTHSSNTLEGQRMEAAFSRFLELHPHLKGVYEIGEGNKLTRNPGASAFCPKCEREHDGDNAFLNVSDAGVVNFYCCRAETALQVDGIILKNECDNDDEEEEEPIVSLPPVRKDKRVDNCHHSRIAYREKEEGGEYLLNVKSESMEDPLKGFRSSISYIEIDSYGPSVLTDKVKEMEGITRPDSDAAMNITIVERLSYVAKEISLQYKLYNGAIVLFRNMEKPVHDVSLHFQWKKPSTGKVVNDDISVAELLAGRYIDGAKYGGGGFPETISSSMRSKILSEIDGRRAIVRRRHQLCFTKLGDVCHIPFFRGQPTPLPNPTSVNIFTGFSADPYKFLFENRRRNNNKFANFMRHELLEVVYILIQYGIAAGNFVDAERAMDFMAYALANLHNPKTGKAMVVIGDYGTGKSTLGNILADIYGHLAINTNMQRVMSRFNGLLAHCMFAMLDEPEPAHNADGTASAAQKAEARNYASRFKEFVTGENTILEDKYEKEKAAKMSINFYLSSNNFDIAVLEVSETRKDRRPIIFDSRTCCLHILPDGSRYYYFYATGEADKCVDIYGQLLNPHPTPAQVAYDKDRFYSFLYHCRQQPDFTSLFAASLLAYAEEYDTSRILHYVQPSDHPVVMKMRFNQVSNVTRFMDNLCGDEFRYSEPLPFHVYARRELRSYMEPIVQDDGITISPKCYFACTENLHKVFRGWFMARYGNHPPNLTTFEKDLAIYASRNPDKMSLCNKVGKVDRRATICGKKITGYCFITYTQDIILHFGTLPNQGDDTPAQVPQPVQQPPPTPIPTPQPTIQHTPDAPSPLPILTKENTTSLILPANKPFFEVPLVDDRYKKLEERNRELEDQVKSQGAKLDQMMQMMQLMMQQQRT